MGVRIIVKWLINSPFLKHLSLQDNWQFNIISKQVVLYSNLVSAISKIKYPTYWEPFIKGGLSSHVRESVEIMIKRSNSQFLINLNFWGNWSICMPSWRKQRVLFIHSSFFFISAYKKYFIKKISFLFFISLSLLVFFHEFP